MALARQEFRDSPLYRQLLVSPDLKTTALLIYFVEDPVYRDLREQRHQLRQQKAEGPFTQVQQAALERVTENLLNGRQFLLVHRSLLWR